MSSRATRNRSTTGRLKGTFALAILSLALFALPGQALAGDPCTDSTSAQYANQTQQCLAADLGSGQNGEGPAKSVAVPQSSGSSLPFTGLDVAALAVVAMALTGTGIVLRRLATIGDSEK